MPVLSALAMLFYYFPFTQLSGWHPEFSGKDQIECPAILIEVDGSTDFTVEKINVPTGASEHDNRISFAEVISQSELFSSYVEEYPGKKWHQDEEPDANTSEGFTGVCIRYLFPCTTLYAEGCYRWVEQQF